jgi:hypothetical protein
MTALGAARIQHLAATDGAHAGPEAMRASTVQIAGLVGAFHERVSEASDKKGAEGYRASAGQVNRVRCGDAPFDARG